MLKPSPALLPEAAVDADRRRVAAASRATAPATAGALVEAYREHGYRRASIDPL
jgi:2-oxoglutarate dehydrogenase complex dehydrogenase (E1) component-like enzyme